MNLRAPRLRNRKCHVYHIISIFSSHIGIMVSVYGYPILYYLLLFYHVVSYHVISHCQSGMAIGNDEAAGDPGYPKPNLYLDQTDNIRIVKIIRKILGGSK